MNFAERVTAWAAQEPSVKAVVLIGSRVRSSDDDIWRADAQSDWDFQIITSRPELFEEESWTKSLGYPRHVYAVRRAAIGGVPKVAALFNGAEADFVILPARVLKLLRIAVKLGLHRRSALLRRRLQDLALIIRPGWKFLKGGLTWEPFYHQVVADIADARLNDAAIRNLADNFVCDAVWTHRKIDRGEWLAAQRMLYRSLLETNFRILHELRLRRGERSFPEARRAERMFSEAELAAINVCVTLDRESLLTGVEKTSATCRDLVRALIGDTWKWPSEL